MIGGNKRLDKKSGDFILENGAIWTDYAYDDFIEKFNMSPESFYNMEINKLKSSDGSWEVKRFNLNVEWNKI
jgi:hypothetical protein